MKTKKYKNGVIFKGEITKDKRHGKGEQVWPDGRTYDGDWKDDTMHGRGTYKWPEGRQYYGDFLTDYMTGKGIYTETSPNVKIQFGEFDNTQLQGKGVQFITIDDKVEIKVGSFWNIGALQNGFKLVTSSKDGQVLEAFQCSNRKEIEWFPKEETKEYEKEIEQLKSQLEKQKPDDSKDEVISKLKKEVETLKLEFASQTKDLKDSFQVKSELEMTLYDTLVKQKELQDTFVKRSKESENKLKTENDELNSKLLETTKLLQETNETLQKYEDENTSLQTQISNLTKTNPMDGQIAEKLKTAAEHIEKLQKTVDEQKTNSYEVEKKDKEKIQILQEENLKFKTKIETLEEEQKAQLEQIEKLITAVKKKEEELKAKFSRSTHTHNPQHSQSTKELPSTTLTSGDNSPNTKSFKKSPRTFDLKSNITPRMSSGSSTPRNLSTPQTPRDAIEKDPSGWKSLLKKTSVQKMEKKETPKVNQIDFRSVLKKKNGEETPRSHRSPKESPKDSEYIVGSPPQ
eukprot:gene5949-9778_t